jgi:hypothetical protein
MEFFPKGRIAFGNGDLNQAINIKKSNKNNAKLQHTLRKKIAGYTLGAKEGSLSFDAICGEDGFERDYFKAVDKGTNVLLRVKLPGVTASFDGVFTEIPVDSSVDDAIKYTCNLIGEWTYQ